MANIKNKTYAILCDDKLLDIYDDEAIRITTILTDNSKLYQNKAVEYSYTFKIPATKANNRILGFMNIPEISGRFMRRFSGEVYSDENLIFTGDIVINEYDAEKEEYSCNLVLDKRSEIDNVFGEHMLNELVWEVPYDGVSTINAVNADMTTKYFFPLCAYALFQKEANNITLSGYRQYTAKDRIDKTGRFFDDSFVPSLNLIETLKRACESVGYKLSGTAISNPILNEIYMSNSISQDQNPLYNWGGDRGILDLNYTFANKIVTGGGRPNTELVYIADNTEYMLNNVPAYPNINPVSQDNLENYESVFVYEPLKKSQGRKIFNDVTVNKNEAKLFNNETGDIRIKNGGWYEITMEGTMEVPEQDMFQALQCTAKTSGQGADTDKTYEMVDIERNVEQTPLEIQLLEYNPEDDGDTTNISHELSYFGWFPNENEAYSDVTTWQDRNILPHYSNTKKPNNPNQSFITAVDVSNNNNYLCGAELYQCGASIGYRKNGYSWKTTDYREGKYNCQGYYYIENGVAQESDYNKNNLLNANDEITYDLTNVKLTYKLHCVMKIKDNSILKLAIQTRGYHDDNDVKLFYKINANGHLNVRAVAPKDIPSETISYDMESKFSKDLQLQNFINDELKTKDFFNNVLKTFNLSFSANEKTHNIFLDNNELNDAKTAINLDDKATIREATFSRNDIPQSIEMKWSIDEEEEGLYLSGIKNSTQEEINNNTFMLNADRGSKPIKIAENGNKALVETSQFSYNWYKLFEVYDYADWKNRYDEDGYPDNKFTQEQYNYYFIPVIGKHDWWIEKRSYQEDCKYDGRSFKQRFWFRQAPYTTVLPVNTEPQVATENDLVKITVPVGYKQIDENTVYLSFEKGNTLLKFFNTDTITDEEVEIECYLTSYEYFMLKKNSKVILNDDIYNVVKIGGYDITGNNKTKITLIKY